MEQANSEARAQSSRWREGLRIPLRYHGGAGLAIDCAPDLFGLTQAGQGVLQLGNDVGARHKGVRCQRWLRL
jgi:hypothetical protein